MSELALSVPDTGKQITKFSASFRQEYLCRKIPMVDLIQELPASSAWRENPAILMYCSNCNNPALAPCKHTGNRALFSTEAKRTRRIQADASVDIPIFRNKRSSYTAA